MLEEVFILLAAYQIKQYLADFFFQTPYMLKGKAKLGAEWIIPLGSHCLVHGLLSLNILLLWRAEVWWLAGFDFIVHFTMDRIKASPNLLGKWSVGSNAFWRVFGFDQMVHHFTHYAIIAGVLLL